MPDWIHEMEAVWCRYPRSFFLLIFSFCVPIFLMLGSIAAANLATGMFQPIIVSISGALWWLSVAFFCYMLFVTLITYLKDREKFFSHF